MSRKRKSTKRTDEVSSKKPRHAEKPEEPNASPARVWDAQLILLQFETKLSDKGNLKDASAMKKYMRGQFDFYGVKTPVRREITKSIFASADKCLKREDIKDLVTLLWSKPQRELQYVAMDFLEKHRKIFCGSQACFEENIEFFQGLVIDKPWWDTVDMLAYKLVGYLVQLHSALGVAVMNDWVCSDHMWLRRTAILHQLGCKENTNEKLLFKFCKLRCHETEFFIQKAIGWALRDFARTKPNEVKRFLQKNREHLSKLSFNEAAKHLHIERK